MSKLISILSSTVLLLMVIITLGSFVVGHWISAPLMLKQDQLVVVNKGDSLSKLAYQLERQGVLSTARLFTLYARITDKTKLEVGEYLLAQGSSPKQLLELLQSGNVISYKVALIEGKTFKDFVHILHNTEKMTSSLKNNIDYTDLLEELNIEHPEGWFFPDTYRFTSGTIDRDILVQSHQRMKKVLAEEWAKKAEDLPYQSAYEALIMASIIEKETGVAHEREAIAGVFVRRLQKGMRLQTDPTIIYGLGDSYKGNIRRKHLTQKTPYNTYMINGLPPTPIAMPGREAIHAALHPKAGKALYFVAKGDGSHYFSASLAEHNKAVSRYQIKRRSKTYQSSPSLRDSNNNKK
jgi:UPF0755 protein